MLKIAQEMHGILWNLWEEWVTLELQIEPGT